jgi:hypothetical protein
LLTSSIVSSSHQCNQHWRNSSLVVVAAPSHLFFCAAVVVCMWSHHEALRFSAQRLLLQKFETKIVLKCCVSDFLLTPSNLWSRTHATWTLAPWNIREILISFAQM